VVGWPGIGSRRLGWGEGVGGGWGKSGWGGGGRRLRGGGGGRKGGGGGGGGGGGQGGGESDDIGQSAAEKNGVLGGSVVGKTAPCHIPLRENKIEIKTARRGTPRSRKNI